MALGELRAVWFGYLVEEEKCAIIPLSTRVAVASSGTLLHLQPESCPTAEEILDGAAATGSVSNAFGYLEGPGQVSTLFVLHVLGSRRNLTRS